MQSARPIALATLLVSFGAASAEEVDDSPASRVVAADAGPLVQVEFVAKGRRLVVLGRDGVPSVVDVDSGETRVRADVGPWKMPSFTIREADGWIAGPSGMLVRVLDLETLEEVKQDDGSSIGGVSLSLGKVVTATFEGRHPRIWTANEKGTITTFEPGDPKSYRAGKPTKSLVNVFAATPDGKWVAAGTSDGRIVVYATGNSRVKSRWETGHDAVRRMVVDPRGKVLLTSGSDGAVRMWSVRGKSLGEFDGHGATVDALAIHPRGGVVASGDAGGTVRVWRLEGQKELDSMTLAEGKGVTSLAFDPSGKTLAVTGLDAGVRLFEVPNDWR